MNIESILKRAGGTKTTMGVIEYHFAPLTTEPDAAHVADVTNETHIAQFLAIPEGYRIYNPNGIAAATVAELGLGGEDDEEAKHLEVLNGSSVHPASFDINGKQYALGDIVCLAKNKSTLSADDWNGLSDEARADFIDEALDELKAATPEQDEREKLVILYKEKFNKEPHHNAGVAKLRKELGLPLDEA